MFHFENNYIFVFLILVPIFIGIFMAANLQLAHLRAKIATNEFFAKLAPRFDWARRKLKFGLVTAAVAFLVIALANPRAGIRTQKARLQSVDMYVALDVSKSMWAQDVAPNRMERARQFALKLLNEMIGKRIAVIAFAGDATLEVPLTTDYAAAEIQIRNANPADEPLQGTAMEEAIELVARAQEREKKPSQKALVFITDGENHEDVARTKAEFAASKGVVTYIVGIGTETGAPIPVNSDAYAGFQLDKEGKVVQSKMNKSLMVNIATASGGEFFDLNAVGADNTVANLKKSFATLQASEFEQRAFDDYDTYFYIFALIALALLVIDFALPYAKN